ncbi:MAG: hypothetical protein KDA53_07630 [Hyphomonas sp.]|nr:hypothetical protein [Hyphomonas sp.]
MVAAIGLVGARITWLVIDPAGAVTESKPLARMDAGNSPSVALSRADYARLLSEDPFNNKAAPAPIQTVRTTQLNLQLRGVRADVEGEGGMAIISVSGGPAKRFLPGDTLLDGVVLEQVMADRVIIRKNGEPEALLMPAAEGHLSVLDKVSDAAHPAASSPETSSATGAGSGVQLSSMKVEPVYRNQALYGYRGLSFSSDGSSADIHIAPADIILEIDGVAARDFDVTSIADKLSSQQPVRFRIDRAGEVLEQTMSPSGTE